MDMVSGSDEKAHLSDMVVTGNIWIVAILFVKILALLMHLIGRYLMDTKN